jgi:peptide/nickel transport system ATP-binding protein
MIARAAQLAGADRAAAVVRAKDLLDLVGLTRDVYARRPAAFSGGQRQRIGIARALAMEPRVLIADESVSALDVLVQRQILDLLADLQARLGVAMLFITHDLRTACAIGDRIAVMQQGKLVELADAASLLAAPQAEYTRQLIAAIPGRRPPLARR